MKVGELHEALVTLLDLLERYVGQSLHAKIFHGERRHHRAIDDCATDAFLGVIALNGPVAP